MLQAAAAVLDFLPVPGLDGYGVVEPWLSAGTRRQVEPFAPFGLPAVFACLWIPEVDAVFRNGVDAVVGALGISWQEVSHGARYFRFREGEPRNVLIPR
ncbi:hypothetical protein [Streptomyces sp. CNQ085]|uniref:hypothetical protein n=1 Tax=Streptomyces sp. CNQ085 TaxID=2886944 RepID=UPI0027E3C147|nr:hypothetical protein [Streptomyces sp. CNQ085]